MLLLVASNNLLVCLPQRPMSRHDTMDVLTAPITFLDTLKAAALVAVFIGFLATCAALVEWSGLDLARSC